MEEDPAAEAQACVAYDLIQMTTAHNGDKWISHFRCYFTGKDSAYTHSKKSKAVDIVTELLNLARNRYGRTIRYFRTDGEASLATGGRSSPLKGYHNIALSASYTNS
jgi:hypothetical protein